MLAPLTDEDFHGALLKGLLRRQPDLDVVRVQDVGLRSEADPDVLAWAAQAERVVLSHDVNTMTKEAYIRIDAGLSVSGLFLINRAAPFQQLIDDVLYLAEVLSSDEAEGRIFYVPL